MVTIIEDGEEYTVSQRVADKLRMAEVADSCEEVECLEGGFWHTLYPYDLDTVELIEEIVEDSENA